MRKVKIEKLVEIEIDIDDFTDDEILKEVETRGIVQPEKGTEDFSDEEIRCEYEHRFGTHSSVTIAQVYEEFRRRGDAPQVLRDYIYDHGGRILP